MISAARNGRAELVFAAAPSGETFLSRQYAAYPFHLCRPHRYVGDPSGMATLYLQSVAGGIFEGDRLAETVRLDAGAQAHVTTQAATIVHAMERDEATLSVELTLGEEAFLEYLPEALIFFPMARLSLHSTLRLGHGARAIIGESFIHHDPAGGGGRFQHFDGETAIHGPTGELLVLDRFSLQGACLNGLLHDYGGHGWLAMIASAGPEEPLGRLRTALGAIEGIYAGASALPHGAGWWIRILATDGARLRQAMQIGWRTMRTILTGVEPAERRK